MPDGSQERRPRRLLSGQQYNVMWGGLFNFTFENPIRYNILPLVVRMTVMVFDERSIPSCNFREISQSHQALTTKFWQAVC
jgi:hypothetical protein